MYKIINSIALLSLTFLLQAQIYSWRAKVIDANTGIGVEYASIYIKGTNIACFSDEYGLFELQIPLSYLQYGRQITVQNTAYIPFSLALDTTILRQNFNIPLNTKPIFLCAFTLTELKALTVIKRAVAALDSTYISSANKQHYYYCQTHQENGKYVRLIEAFLDYYPKRYAINSQKIQTDCYTISSLARSNNYEQNDYVHGEHLNDLLLENYFVYPLGSPLYLKNSSYFTYKFADTCDHVNYYIYFDTKSSSNSLKTRGTITIDKQSFAIRSIDVEKYKNAKSENNAWTMRYAHLFLSTKEENGKLLVDHLLLNYSHDVQHQITKINQWVVEERFELKYLETIPTNVKASALTSDLSHSLYTMHYSAADFVAEKNKYKISNYAPVLRNDLEVNHSIEQQWLENE